MSTKKGQVVHVNSATLVMGVTGAGKSYLLDTLVRYVWETYHKVTLLYSSDGGGFPTRLQASMQRGLVRVFRMRTRDLPDGSLSFETCQRSAQGWWPEKINATTGETTPGVRMVPPITEKYDMACPQGHPVKSVPFQSLLTATLCPTCRVMTDKSNMRVTKTAHRTKGFEDVGAVCYDGLTSMLSWMMADMSQRAGRLELKGEEGAIGGKIISGDMKFGSNSRGHYGFTQSHAEQLALNSLGIPNLVVPPVFTALTLETDDEGDLRVRGPKLAGRAKTDEAPQWFGNCLEAMVVKSPKDERIYRLCLSEFIDDAGVRHLVKTRADAGSMPAFLEDPPLVVGHERETAGTNFNLGVFYTMLAQGLAQSLAEIDADPRYQDAPGLPEGMVQVGEGSTDGAGGKLPSEAGGPAPKAGPVTVGPPSVGKPSTAPPAAPPRSAGPPARPVVAAAPKPAGPPAPTFTPPLATESQPPAVATAGGPATALLTAAKAALGTAKDLGGNRVVVAAKAWAAPAAPRPPAAAPRVGAPLAKKP